MSEVPPPSYEAATGGQAKEEEKVKLQNPGINPGYSSLDPSPAYPGSANPGSAYPGSAYPGSANPGSAYPGSAYPGSINPGFSNLGPAYPPEVVIVQPRPAPIPPEERMRAEHHGELPPPQPESSPDDVCCGDKGSQTCGCCCRVTISTLAHLGFLAGVLGLIFTAPQDSFEDTWLPLTITASVCYGLLWLEVWCSQDFTYLNSIKSIEQFRAYMSTMHGERPAIGFSVECYHNETRYRTVYSTDAQGNTTSSTESYTERVVTHKEKETFEFSRCRETSPPNINLDNNRATRVTFYSTWHFADHPTKGAYDLQYLNIQARNRHRDTYMDSHETFELPGFKKRMLAYVNPASNHPCYHPCAYICLSCFVLTWPYRWWFKSSTGRTNYTFDKEIGL